MDGPSLLAGKTKRDEWSEGAILSLLQIYESKWLFRNRAKLKGTDWDEIARQVSIHYPASNARKTPSQCKNKIESMKKRYRAEAAAAAENPSSVSSWHFFARMDSLLKSDIDRKSKLDLGADAVVRERGSDSSAKGFEGGSDVSTPRVRVRVSKRRRGVGGKEVAESIELLADSMLRIEQGRMEMFRDYERVRAEAEIRKWEMEVKRTEIVLKAQLQIAKIVVKRLYGKGNGQEGSALKTELDMLSRREVMGD